MKKRKLDEERNAETWMRSKKWREMTAWKDYISHKTNYCNELDADFNFPKIGWMSHWVEPIRRYRALQQYSAERPELAHKTNLTNVCNSCNLNLHYVPQVITFQRLIVCFEIAELYFQDLA
jgi:hypothetical protein